MRSHNVTAKQEIGLDLSLVPSSESQGPDSGWLRPYRLVRRAP